MFNVPANNQQLVPMGMQQQQIANMPVQTIQTYIPAIQNMPQETDTFINVSNQQQQTGKGFWDGFKSVFSKIGEFCTNNFGLILTGLGIFGGYKFCSSSMQTYEENKKEKKLDDKGNLKDKDATIKENIMNFVGHGVHYVFGSNKEIEENNEEKNNTSQNNETGNKDEATKLDDKYIFTELENGNITNLLKAYKTNEGKIKILEVISQEIDNLPKSTCWDKRQSTIINTLQDLIKSDDNDIQKRAINVAKALKGKNYFNTKQKERLEEIISKLKTEESKDEEKRDTED